MSKGRGIITTFPPSDVDFFLKLLKVIHYLGNDLPIQILSNGHELSDKVIKQTSQLGKETNQQIRLLTYHNLLDRENRKYVSRDMNKFFACLFNIFEEYIYCWMRMWFHLSNLLNSLISKSTNHQGEE